MSDQQSKSESSDSSSDQSKKQIKSLDIKLPSTREEKKFQQYLQRIKQQEKQEEIATLKRKRSKLNPKEEQQDEEQQPILLNPQIVLQQTENQITKIKINPKLKIKTQHHIYLYLSDCQDKVIDDQQKLNQTSKQFYSPTKINKVQSNINQINQDIQQETIYLITNIKTQYQQQQQKQLINSNEQNEFFNKYFDKQYIEQILRESRSYKKIEKQKFIPKKY